MPAQLQVTDTPQGVRVLVLRNEARRNAIDDGALHALRAALVTPPSVRALLIRGDGQRAFCSGYDLTALEARAADAPPPDGLLGAVLDELMHHRLPSVALVHGPAFGAGCELACACDFRVGSPDAVFCLPAAQLGIVYALPGLQRLMLRAGPTLARRMALTGQRVAADVAERAGLLDVRADDAASAADALCAQLCAAAPLAVQGMKQGLARLAVAATTDEGYQALRRQAFASADAREGVAAMLAKRPPRFSGW